MLWLAEQGLVAPIAISSFALLLTILIVKLMIKVKGDNMMENKVKEMISASFEILYTMSANLAGGALLAKALQ